MTRARLLYADVILTVVREIESRPARARIARTEKAMREYLQIVNRKSQIANG